MITIQHATPTEAKLITNLGTISFIESHGHSAPAADIESYISKTYNVKAIEEELNDPENIFHIIYYNDRPAGFSKIIFNSPYPLIDSAAVTKLEKIYLLKEFYGFKLGAALLEFIINLSKKQKQTGIWLYTWTENQRAINFYKKNGFKIIGSADFKISAAHSNPNHIMFLEYESE